MYGSVNPILIAGFEKIINPDFKTSGSSVLLDGHIQASGNQAHVYVDII